MSRFAVAVVCVVAVALVGCSASDAGPEPTSDATATLPLLPGSDRVEFAEAESVLGIQLVFPGYVPNGLVLEDEATIDTGPKWENATIAYTLNETLTDAPVISILTVVQWAPGAKPDLRLDGDGVEVDSKTVVVDGYAASPDSYNATATWMQDERYIMVTAFGFDGVPGAMVRDEVLRTVRSIVEQRS